MQAVGQKSRGRGCEKLIPVFIQRIVTDRLHSPWFCLAWLFPAPGPHHVSVSQNFLQANRRTQLIADVRWKERCRQTK